MSSSVVSCWFEAALRRSRFIAVFAAAAVHSATGAANAETTPVLERFRADPDVRALMGPYSALARTGQTIHSFPLEPGRIPDPDTPMIGVLRSDDLEQGDGANHSVISRGTAYLYEQFAIGRLEGHRYGHPASERALRDAIWSLEDPMHRPVRGSNVFLRQAVDRFGSLEAAREPYTGRRVRVISLIPDTRREKLHGFFGKSAVVYGKGPSDVSPAAVPVFTGPAEQIAATPGGWLGPAGILFAGAGVPTSTVAGSTSSGEESSGNPSAGGGVVGGNGGGPPSPPPPVRVPESGNGLLLMALALLVVGAGWAWTRIDRA